MQNVYNSTCVQVLGMKPCRTVLMQEVWPNGADRTTWPSESALRAFLRSLPPGMTVLDDEFQAKPYFWSPVKPKQTDESIVDCEAICRVALNENVDIRPFSVATAVSLDDGLNWNDPSTIWRCMADISNTASMARLRAFCDFECPQLYLRSTSDPTTTQALFDHVINICRVDGTEVIPYVCPQFIDTGKSIPEGLLKVFLNWMRQRVSRIIVWNTSGYADAQDPFWVPLVQSVFG